MSKWNNFNSFVQSIRVLAIRDIVRMAFNPKNKYSTPAVATRFMTKDLTEVKEMPKEKKQPLEVDVKPLAGKDKAHKDIPEK